MSWAPVLSKPDFVRRYKAGEFGNASPTWDTFEEWIDVHFTGDDPSERMKHRYYHIRGRGRSNTFSRYNVCGYWLPYDWNDVLVESQLPAEAFYISEMAPHEYGTLQGEVYESECGIRLTYTLVKKPMRTALQESMQVAEATLAVSLLRTYMNARSYDWLMELMERYDGHVIEFSCFNRCWGTVPGYNTVFWEVRNY